jgi:hypothetical protein
MGPETFTDSIGIWLAAILTICVYSFLIKDNFMFKLTEALFVGVSVGYAIVLTYQNGIYPKIQQPLVRYYHNLNVDKADITSSVATVVHSLADGVESDPSVPFRTNGFLSVLDSSLHRTTMDLSHSKSLETSLRNSIVGSELDLRNTPALIGVTETYLGTYKKIETSQHYWVLYIFLSLCLGVLYLSRFVPKYAWLSRFPMAYLLGIGVGIGIPLGFQTQILGQIQASIIPIVFTAPGGEIVWVPTIGNIVLLVGILTVLYYFFFSLKKTDRFSQGMTKVGIGYLMLGFGASFAFTIMARISLLTGRVEFLKDEWYLPMIHPYLEKFWSLFTG